MAQQKTDILVFAHWAGMTEPRCIGILSALQTKGRKVFSFAYSPEWLQSGEQFLLDPDITLYRGPQFPIGKENTDDHLRNHGFLLTQSGWRLSPAYDINPSIDKSGLSLNIDTQNNALDFDIAISIGEYFQLGSGQMDLIIGEVLASVREWKSLASEIGISRNEQGLMARAFGTWA